MGLMAWLKRVLKELKRSTTMPVKLYYDNITAISITHSAVQYDRKKHVEINKHIIKEKFEA